MINLDIKLDINSHEPAYTQIKNRLRDEIVSGQLKDINKLPPVRDLAAATGVSLGTMDRVIDELVDEGFCFRRPRVGIYVKRRNILTGQRHIIHLCSECKPNDANYEQRILALGDSRIYQNCRFQSRFISGDLLHSSAFNYELGKIKAERPDCLLAEAVGLTRDEVRKLISMPFPVMFIGDFKFGEIRDPDLNQIREDTVERGYELVKAVHSAGCREAAFFGGSPDCFYVTLLRAGAEQAAKECGISLRYYQLSEDGCNSDEEICEAHRKSFTKMLQDGRPDIVIFDGHDYLARIIRALERPGITVGKDIKLISNRELVPGGIFLQPDYSLFRREAAEIIMSLACDRNYHPGSRLLSGKITYRPIAVSSL